MIDEILTKVESCTHLGQLYDLSFEEINFNKQTALSYFAKRLELYDTVHFN